MRMCNQKTAGAFKPSSVTGRRIISIQYTLEINKKTTTLKIARILFLNNLVDNSAPTMHTWLTLCLQNFLAEKYCLWFVYSLFVYYIVFCCIKACLSISCYTVGAWAFCSFLYRHDANTKMKCPTKTNLLNLN